MDDDGSLPRPRRIVLGGLVLAAVVGVVLVVGAAMFLGSGDGDASADSPVLLGTVASSTTRPAASTTTIPLSQPENPPDDEYADVPVVEVASIEIPSIGLTAPVSEGIWLTVLDRGPGHWPGTAAPGGWGNVVIAGHRVTFTQPFRHIDDLVPGDTVVLTDATGRYTYSVTGSSVVTPEEVDIVTQRAGRTITLFACHPPGSAAYRYVVSGTLISPPRPGA